MYRIAHGTTHDLADVSDFVGLLDTLDQHPSQEVRELFDPRADIYVARAPGRLDVMGGIADYSGSLVLEMPIHEATLVALQRDAERRLRVVSLSEEPGRVLTFEMALSDFDGDGLMSYEAAREYFRRDPARHWAAYVAGVVLVLMRERGAEFREGARILVSSRVPGGKGVSSSAALEVATMQAAAAAFDVSLDARDTALLCQRVENLVVGAPCGVMDQMTSVCGEEGRLLTLLCQPAELQGVVEIPAGVSFWGLDSGVRHAVTGADYGSVRVGAFMGYRIIAELAGLKVETDRKDGPVGIEDPRWGGYLSNVTPSEFEQSYAAALPERIGGAEFLSRYAGTHDTVTRVVPTRGYAVRVPAAHAVYEHHRVRLFRELLGGADVGGERLRLLGELMYQSHASYSACGLGVEGTDRLVELVREAGPARGLYGAKITGGGSGGTVAVLGGRDAGAAVEEVADRYAQETGHRPYVFARSSPGGAAFGHLILKAVG
ncbi:MAG TPA: galactokinase family protein [Pyrinomonadaceae bacterium]|jgi:L-arabinokinase|nr:galactokinase family protein [Pyrinomonadaceae bacterium]